MKHRYFLCGMACGAVLAVVGTVAFERVFTMPAPVVHPTPVVRIASEGWRWTPPLNPLVDPHWFYIQPLRPDEGQTATPLSSR